MRSALRKYRRITVRSKQLSRTQIIRKYIAFAAAITIAVPATVAATAAQVKNIPAPQGTKWSEKITKTPSLGYVMGNPDAPVKIIEYGSLTCSHCKSFEAAAFPKLRDTYVNSGRVSFEFRNYTLNVVDVPTGILTRCQGPKSYFKLSEAVFDNQNAIISGVQNTRQEILADVDSLPANQKFVKFSKVTGITKFFTDRGMTEKEANACLANPSMLNELLSINGFASNSMKVNSTPTFFINGSRINGGTWAQVEAKLNELGVR